MQSVLNVPKQDGSVLFLEIDTANWFMPQG